LKNYEKGVFVMKTTYWDKEEILKAIDNDNNSLTGIVEISFNDFIWNDEGIEYLNDLSCRQLVGEEYAYLLEDISYKIVGCDIEKQTLFIEVTVSVESLLNEIEFE
jgi:hypothetical protein